MFQRFTPTVITIQYYILVYNRLHLRYISLCLFMHGTNKFTTQKYVIFVNRVDSSLFIYSSFCINSTNIYCIVFFFIIVIILKRNLIIIFVQHSKKSLCMWFTQILSQRCGLKGHLPFVCFYIFSFFCEFIGTCVLCQLLFSCLLRFYNDFFMMYHFLGDAVQYKIYIVSFRKFSVPSQSIKNNKVQVYSAIERRNGNS